MFIIIINTIIIISITIHLLYKIHFDIRIQYCNFVCPSVFSKYTYKELIEF